MDIKVRLPLEVARSHCECGQEQGPPTSAEINGCPEIIVRVCAHCGRGLYWSTPHWHVL